MLVTRSRVRSVGRSSMLDMSVADQPLTRTKNTSALMPEVTRVPTKLMSRSSAGGKIADSREGALESSESKLSHLYAGQRRGCCRAL